MSSELSRPNVDGEMDPWWWIFLIEHYDSIAKFIEPFRAILAWGGETRRSIEHAAQRAPALHLLQFSETQRVVHNPNF